MQNIIVNDNASVTIPQCDCQSSTFCDNDLGHIVTGKLNFVENNKLRKLLSKGPNYREPRCLNFDKCIKTIEISLNNFMEK